MRLKLTLPEEIKKQSLLHGEYLLFILDDAEMMPAPRAAALHAGYPQPMAVVALAPRAAAAAPELPDGRPEARP